MWGSQNEMSCEVNLALYYTEDTSKQNVLSKDILTSPAAFSGLSPAESLFYTDISAGSLSANKISWQQALSYISKAVTCNVCVMAKMAVTCIGIIFFKQKRAF